MRAAIILTMTPVALVMMPVLSRIAHDRRQFGAAYGNMAPTTGTVWLPAVAVLGLVAPKSCCPARSARTGATVFTHLVIHSKNRAL